MNGIISEVYSVFDNNISEKKVSGSFLELYTLLSSNLDDTYSFFTLGEDDEGKWQKKVLLKMNNNSLFFLKDEDSYILSDEYVSLKNTKLLDINKKEYSEEIKEKSVTSLIISSPLLSSLYSKSILNLLEDVKDSVMRVIVFDRDPRVIISLENFYSSLERIKEMYSDVLMLGESVDIFGIKRISKENLYRYI